MRYSLIEYGAGIPISQLLENGITEASLKQCIDSGNNYILSRIKTASPPLQVKGVMLRAAGVAGIINIGRGIELEIIPKFLSDFSSSEWQPILYLLAALSEYGDLLPQSNIAASTNYRDSLYELAGQIMAKEYERCSRNFIREYNKKTFSSFSIDGELDLDYVFAPDSDGWKQYSVEFDRRNNFNSIMKEAFVILRPHTVSDITLAKIEKAIQDFGPQDRPILQYRSLPAQNREWDKLYSLAFNIVSGAHASFNSGHYLGDGFVVNTWRIWQWLITSGMRTKNTNYLVRAELKAFLGKSVYKNQDHDEFVYPDISLISFIDNEIKYLIDAKYKTLDESNETVVSIDRNDLYEGIAYCLATGVQKIIMAYPDDKPLIDEPGAVRKLQTYYIKDIQIHVVKIAFGCKSRKGISEFQRNIKLGIYSILHSSTI